MFYSLRRETVKFGHDFVYQLVAGVETWKSCGGKFKAVSVWLLVFFALMIPTHYMWHALRGQPAPSGFQAVLFFGSPQIAKLAGKKCGWL